MPLGDFKNIPGGSKTPGAAPGTFYNPLFALAPPATLRFKEMSWAAERGHEALKATEFDEKELGVKVLSGYFLAKRGIAMWIS